MANLTFTSVNLQCPTAVNGARDKVRAARDFFGKLSREERGKNWLSIKK